MSAWDWVALAGVGAALMIVRGYMFKQWGNAGPADRAGLALVPLGFVAGLALAFYLGNGVPIQTAFTVALLGLCAGGYVAAGGSLLLWLFDRLGLGARGRAGVVALLIVAALAVPEVRGTVSDFGLGVVEAVQDGFRGDG